MDVLSQCNTSKFDVNDIRTLLLLLSSPENTITIASLDALTKYAEIGSKKRLQLLNNNIINELLKLVRSVDIGIKKNAVACLAASTEVVDIHADMRRKDVIDTLINILAQENTVEATEVLDEAAFALANCARDFSTKVLIRKKGGMKILVKLLENPDPDIKKNAALALASVLEDFSNRSEMRYIGGLSSIVDLLSSEFREIQNCALMCLVKCSEDVGNRIEFRKLGVIKKLLDILSVSTAESSTSPETKVISLLCVSNLLEDAETALAFPLSNGITILTKFLSHDDAKCCIYAALGLQKAAKVPRNHTYIREAGALPLLFANLSHVDASIQSSAAGALVNLCKNDINQVEFSKLGGIDLLVKLLSHDNLEVQRSCVLALASLCVNQKVRMRVRLLGVQYVVNLLNLDDLQVCINAAECLSNLAEDSESRSEIVKAGNTPTTPTSKTSEAGKNKNDSIQAHNGIKLLFKALSKPYIKLQSTAAVALSRFMTDNECRNYFFKQNLDINVVLNLLKSKDMVCCRNGSLLLSNLCEYEPNAVIICKSNAIELLTGLIVDKNKGAGKFATEALNSMLKHYNPAKYWLRNRLSSENIINNGFYDLGYAGDNLKNMKSFPSLEQLYSEPINKKREVLLIDTNHDEKLESLIALAEEGLLEKTPLEQLVSIAKIVVSHLGGTVDEPEYIGNLGYQFHITELKLKLESNVIPIGELNVGSFYHRALLFKTICDRVGLNPCTLVRGDYNRAWNEIDVGSLNSIGRNLVGGMVNDLQGNGMRDEYAGEISGVCIVDLMYDAGELIAINSARGLAYRSI